MFLLEDERAGGGGGARAAGRREGARATCCELADFPTVRQALETRRARAFTEEDHAHGEGDPFDGVLDLPPGHSCMVVPLCAGERCYGVLTLDRTECETYPQAVVDLVEVYGQMLATALQNAEQKARLRAAAPAGPRARQAAGGAAGRGRRRASSRRA